jgi:hypothetical protein
MRGGFGCAPKVATMNSLSSFFSSRMTLIVGRAQTADGTEPLMSCHASGRRVPPSFVAR